MDRGESESRQDVASSLRGIPFKGFQVGDSLAASGLRSPFPMVRIFIAPAAASRLHAAREFLERFPPSTEVLVVSANRGAADDLVRTLAKQQVATFGFHRFSLTQLAFRLAAGRLAARSLTPVTRLAAQASAAHVAYRLASKGELPYFAPVSEYPGFAPSLANTLQELRLGRVTPTQVSADLSRLLAAYNGELDENGFSDAAVLFELAAEVLRTEPPPIAASPLLLLDLRCESKAQREFVRRIVAGSADVLVTVQTADETTRQFAIARRNAARIAADYVSEGFSVVIDDVVREVDMPQYVPYLGGLAPRKVLLSPSIFVVHRRNAQRTNKTFDTKVLEPVATRLHGQLLAGCPPEAGWKVIDTSTLSIDDTIERILKLHEGVPV